MNSCLKLHNRFCFFALEAIIELSLNQLEKSPQTIYKRSCIQKLDNHPQWRTQNTRSFKTRADSDACARFMHTFFHNDSPDFSASEPHK